MSDLFNENHLLWWVLKAIDKCCIRSVDVLTDESLWQQLDAPEWVLPAMEEKSRQFFEAGQ